MRVRTVAILRPDKEVLNSDYLYYSVTTTSFRGAHAQFKSGSVQGYTNLPTIRRLPLTLPPLPEQRRIAAVLGALDDKIELNRKMNRTLEAMAQALFKSWFIDFDGHDDLVPSELGPIPRGWEVKTIGDIIDRKQVGKKYNQKTVMPTGDVPVLDQGKSGIIGYHNDEPGVCASLEQPIAVFANHTCLMRLITFSFSTIQNVLPFHGRGVDTIWAFYATLGKQKFSEYKGHWPDFVIHKLPVPSVAETVRYAELVRPLVARQRANEVECDTLAALRDTLLPKLISGEIRVPEVEDTVQEAGL